MQGFSLTHDIRNRALNFDGTPVDGGDGYEYWRERAVYDPMNEMWSTPSTDIMRRKVGEREGAQIDFFNEDGTYRTSGRDTEKAGMKDLATAAALLGSVYLGGAGLSAMTGGGTFMGGVQGALGMGAGAAGGGAANSLGVGGMGSLGAADQIAFLAANGMTDAAIASAFPQLATAGGLTGIGGGAAALADLGGLDEPSNLINGEGGLDSPFNDFGPPQYNGPAQDPSALRALANAGTSYGPAISGTQTGIFDTVLGATGSTTAAANLAGTGGIGGAIVNGVTSLADTLGTTPANLVRAGGALLGGIAGAQGTPATPAQRSLDPRMDARIFGQGGLLSMMDAAIAANPGGMNQTMRDGHQMISNVINHPSVMPGLLNMGNQGQNMMNNLSPVYKWSPVPGFGG